MTHKNHENQSQIASGVMYGIINGILCIPVTVSFCSIIFRDDGFAPHMPQLVKLVLFSSAVHQICFSMFSSLPFAVGQVQDAGLIFLSAIAASVVESCDRPEMIVATTLYVLSICTFLLGIMLLVVSKLKLASIIQYLPMPVIGGYLAYIGFFCGEAGLAMMGGITVTGIRSFLDPHALFLMTPGLLIGLSMYMLLRNVRSPFVLPCSMVAVLVLFYSALWVSGGSFEDARHFGWIAPLTPLEPFYHSWQLYDITLVDWSQLPNQAIRLLCMFLVVAFSSSLDVAAIEMEVGLPLDYNTELYTVGMSNVVSGLLGGYTGSYIFSQTIFNLRRKVNTRLCGYVVAACELLVVVIPVSVTSFIPKFFFGSLLVLIAVDLMSEWLIGSRHKMTTFEYAVCLSTFLFIVFTGIEFGMMMGVLLAMMSFVVTYARLQTVSVASLLSSTVVRTFEERAVLIANRGKVVTISLKGYIFFGSAVSILEEVKSHVVIQQTIPIEMPSPRTMKNSYVNRMKTGEDKALLSTEQMAKNYQAVVGKQKLAMDLHALQQPGHLMPRYSFTMTSTPQMKRPPLVKRNSGMNGDLGNASYQSQQSGIIASLLSRQSSKGDYQSVSSCNTSDDGSSHPQLTATWHPPSASKTKKRTVSFDAENQSGSGDEGDGVEMGTSKSYAHYAAQAAKAAIASTPDSRDNSNNSYSSVHRQGNSSTGSNSQRSSPATTLDSHPSDNKTTSPSSQPRVSPTFSSSMARKKGSSLFATIWENQVAKREKLLENVDVHSSPKREAPRREVPNRDMSSKEVREGKFSPPDTRTLQPTTSVLKHVSAFPDIEYGPEEEAEPVVQQQITTEYLVLDFSNVLGVDATAARSCFMMLVQLMKSSNVVVVFAHLSPSTEAMFRTQRVIKDGDIVIPLLDDALEWCEEQVLHSYMQSTGANRSYPLKRSPSHYARASRSRQDQLSLKSASDRDSDGYIGFSGGAAGPLGYASPSTIREEYELGNKMHVTLPRTSPTPNHFANLPPTSAASLRKILLDYLETDAGSNSLIDNLLTSELLLRYFRQSSFSDRELVFDIDDPSDQVYFIESGNVEIVTIPEQQIDVIFKPSRKGPVLVDPSAHVHRVNKVSSGGAFGESDFFLGRNHCVRAYTLTPCVCWLLDRDSYAAMEVAHPALCLLIQHTLLKSLAISSTCSMYSHHSGDSSSAVEPGNC